MWEDGEFQLVPHGDLILGETANELDCMALIVT